MKRELTIGALVFVGFWTLLFVGWNLTLRTPVDVQQIGFDGVAMEQLEFADDKAAKAALPINQAPAPIYDLAPDDGSTPRASEIYENVQVLGHLSDDNFNRIMAQITEWVSPEQGCAYCHGEEGNFAADDLYTKVVSRSMLRMTQEINGSWSDHVAPAGVNCYTCHRGQPNPQAFWYTDVSTSETQGVLGWRAGQNAPGVALASLPTDPFTHFLLEDNPIRVINADGVHPAPGEAIGTKKTEWTYSLMNHMSTSLGVNCTYCHNSRAFGQWDQSPPARTTAWYGIRMVRDINNRFMEPLQPAYPPRLLGPTGDAPKVYCTTCHLGVNKPLYGADMISAFPSLQAPGPQPWPPAQTMSITVEPAQAD